MVTMCTLQREFIYCYLYVVMLLKSLHYSGGGAQSITLPSSLSASHPATQHIDHPVAQQNVMDISQCSDLPADDDIDDTNTSSGQRIFSCDYHIIFFR